MSHTQTLVAGGEQEVMVQGKQTQVVLELLGSLPAWGYQRNG